MKPIYVPKGKAKEYGDYAINIYTGCPHRCYYCFAPSVLRKDREAFHSNVEPRKGIVEAVKRQLDKEQIAGKLIHLCFTCDPYPVGHDTTVTREIIKLIKASGNHVQILTKGDGSRDFDLLDENDWYGVTISHTRWENQPEPGAIPPYRRLYHLCDAHEMGIKTWVSFEPILSAGDVLELLRLQDGYMDKVKIGKLNYRPSDIDWGAFGRAAERICEERGLDYYIKDSLREEMHRVQ
jgi:DNA repair photolyase